MLFRYSLNQASILLFFLNTASTAVYEEYFLFTILLMGHCAVHLLCYDLRVDCLVSSSEPVTQTQPFVSRWNRWNGHPGHCEAVLEFRKISGTAVGSCIICQRSWTCYYYLERKSPSHALANTKQTPRKYRAELMGSRSLKFLLMSRGTTAIHPQTVWINNRNTIGQA